MVPSCYCFSLDSSLVIKCTRVCPENKIKTPPVVADTALPLDVKICIPEPTKYREWICPMYRSWREKPEKYILSFLKIYFRPHVCCMDFALGVVCVRTYVCIHTFLEGPEVDVSDLSLSLSTLVACHSLSLSPKLMDSARLSGQWAQGSACLLPTPVAFLMRLLEVQTQVRTITFYWLS